MDFRRVITVCGQNSGITPHDTPGAHNAVFQIGAILDDRTGVDNRISDNCVLPDNNIVGNDGMLHLTKDNAAITDEAMGDLGIRSNELGMPTGVIGVNSEIPIT